MITSGILDHISRRGSQNEGLGSSSAYATDSLVMSLSFKRALPYVTLSPYNAVSQGSGREGRQGDAFITRISLVRGRNIPICILFCGA